MRDQDEISRRESPPRESIRARRHRSPIARSLEGLVALALVACAAIQLFQNGQALAEASLWNDEIASIRDFSEPGVRTALTDYSAPNNHILFNALTAVLDWNEPYQPLAARFWSFVAMGLLFVLGTGTLALRGSLLEAGLFAHLVFMSGELVALGLQARGYGLLCLFTLLAALSVWQQQRAPDSSRGWIGLALVGVFGIWTIPTFLLFMAPLMLFTLTAAFRLRHVAVVMLAAVTTLLLHGPVAGEMIAAQRAYSNRWGEQLSSIDPLIDALRLYLFHDESLVYGPNDVGIGLLCIAILALAFSKVPAARVGAMEDPRVDARTARLILSSVFVFLGLLVALRTPPARTLAPILVALVFGGLLAIRSRLPPTTKSRLRAAVAVLVGIVVVPHDVGLIRNFYHQPRESWLPIARFLDRVLPLEIEVTVPWRVEQLELYVERLRVLHTSLARGPLERPGAVLLWSGLDPDPDHAVLAADPRLTPFRFDQNRGRHQTLLLSPPTERSIRRLSLVPRVRGESFLDLAAAIDGDPTSTVRIERSRESGPRYFELDVDFDDVASLTSVIVELSPDTQVERIRAAWTCPGATPRPIPDEDVIAKGSAIAIVLGDPQNSIASRRAEREPPCATLLIRIKTDPHGKWRRLVLHEVFAYRAGNLRTRTGSGTGSQRAQRPADPAAKVPMPS